jgi:hypothetical protein
MRCILGFFILTFAAFPAWAAPTVDGTRDAQYGGALAVQTVETQFGDANPNGGSELDAGYGVADGGRLYLMLTGNVEANFNKLEIFIDSKVGGQSVFDSSGNDGANAMDGLIFDAGFTADYHLIVRRGNDAGNDRLDIDFADLVSQSASGYLDVLGGLTGSGDTGTGVNSQPINVAYDNSNVAGVGGGTNAANQAAAAAVTTGLELGIALSDLGWTGGPIHIMAAQNNQNHNFWSNQFLAGLSPPQGNLGGDEMGVFTGEGAIDMTHFAGNQYFTVIVPEPSAVMLAVFGLTCLAASGRRRQ